jgi:type I restriction enzyme S subunit
MQFKPYPEYKDSGVEWLGEVPAHWGVVRTKNIFHHRREAARNDDEIVTAFRDGQVTLRKNRRTDGFTNSLKEHGYQHIVAGDLVIHEMDAFAGAIGVSDADGKSTPVYTVCYPKNSKYNNQYFADFFRTMASHGYINSLAKGIRIRSTEFRWNESRNVYLCVPSFVEQSAITSFLAQEISKIDLLISKQEKLIELLEEQRKSIISHAVTKGLDPEAPMKDSGVEWLGEVPAHWKVCSIKYISDITTGYNDTVDSMVNGIYPFYVRSNTIEKIDQYTFDCEAVLTAGDGAGVGKVYHYYNGKFSCHQRVYVMYNFNEVRGRYFFFYFSNLFEKVALDGGAKSTVDSLRKAHFDNFYITIPSHREQNEIIEYLNQENYKIDVNIDKQKQLIEKLKEYRSSIISHAVTGKIDCT